MAAVPGSIRAPDPASTRAQPAQRHPGPAGVVPGARRMGQERHGTAAEPRPDGRRQHCRRGRERQDAGGAGLRPRASRQPYRPTGRLGRPAGADRQCLPHPCVRGRCRRQRDRRHQAATDCGSARHLYRVERLPGGAKRARRPRRLVDSLHPYQDRARGEGRPAALDRGARGQPRSLCRHGRSSDRGARRRALLLPADAAAYVKAAEACDRF